jgi:hypothetical protein
LDAIILSHLIHPRNAVNLPERMRTQNSPSASWGVLRSDRTVAIIITAEDKPGIRIQQSGGCHSGCWAFHCLTGNSQQRKLPDHTCAGEDIRSPGGKHQCQPKRNEHSKRGALLVELREFSRAKVAIPLRFENESKVQHCDEKTGDAAEYKAIS